MMLTVLFLAGVLCIAPVVSAADKSGGEHKIVVLQLRLKDGKVSLQNVSVAPGKLKQRRVASKKARAIEFQALSATGKVLSTGVVADPSLRRYEYEDPANPGQLKAVVVSDNNAWFVVRLPWHGKLSSVAFFRRKEQPAAKTPADKTSAGKKSAAAEPDVVRESLGSLELKLESAPQP